MSLPQHFKNDDASVAQRTMRERALGVGTVCRFGWLCATEPQALALASGIFAVGWQGVGRVPADL
jgi:hypothetical protein